MASLALMAAVSYQWGARRLWTGDVALAIVSAVLLLRFRINSAWLVLGGASSASPRGWSRGG